MYAKTIFFLAAIAGLGGSISATGQVAKPASSTAHQPLVTNIYTADPSAHIFGGRIYIYPSHDIESGVKEDDEGGHFDMKDYHVLSMNTVGGPVIDHGLALDIRNIPWAGRQLWAPDAAFRNGTYYLYFPVKDKQDIFRIGVATSTKPTGPFKAEPQPIAGAYSMDPCVFQDADGKAYLYFGGIWGGQLQRWTGNTYDSEGGLFKPDDLAALPRMARLNANMKTLAEPVREVQILDETGQPFHERDNGKRFFEASWLHKYQGKYYFSYSTGDTHTISYAIGTSPYGPFRYRGVVLKPVEGWTNHHSIVQVGKRWFLFYHDAKLSGKTHLRNVKVTELFYNPDGTIQTIDAK